MNIHLRELEDDTDLQDVLVDVIERAFAAGYTHATGKPPHPRSVDYASAQMNAVHELLDIEPQEPRQ